MRTASRQTGLTRSQRTGRILHNELTFPSSETRGSACRRSEPRPERARPRSRPGAWPPTVDDRLVGGRTTRRWPPTRRSGHPPAGHTVYVPADSVDERHPVPVGRAGPHALLDADGPRGSDVDSRRRGLRAGSRKAVRAAGRGPAARFRGRVWQPPDDEEDAAARPPAHSCRTAGRRRPILRRHPVQEPRAGHPPPRRTHADPARRRRAGRRSAAGRVPRHAAQGHLGRPGRGHGRGSANGSSSGTACPAGRLRFEIQVETPQAIVAADGRATVAPMLHTAGAALHRAALRHVRLQRGVWRGGRPTRAWSTRSPTTPRP